MSAGGGAAPKIRATEGAIAEGQWRRLHPLSPLIKAWKGVTVLLAIVLFQNTNLFVNSLSSDYAHSLGTGRIVLIAVGGLLGLVLILGLISYLSWRVTRFAVTDSGVYYRSGILLRTLNASRVLTSNILSWDVFSGSARSTLRLRAAPDRRLLSAF